ncbi:hypothetical protein D9611_003867 [Ephemerocybe angulata]|uniref:Zinc-finger domain-containing protein n=1 Tax=Ephemerocybe angulata TaxID=980116 RepID=A0A8H5EZ01_9AGAR|nr:hypothetical protein D9611_003867 [Tulosesus angulatus]
MSATSTLSSTRKHTASTVYVQVPPSPFDLDQYQFLSARHVPTNNGGKLLKENTPLRAPRTHMSQSASTSSSSLKRKLSDRDSASSASLDTTPANSKKIKSASVGTPLKPTQVNANAINVEPAANACPEYPNGWTYCHQCCKKRDLDATIQCTFLESRTIAKSNTLKQWRCVAKYCKPCLQNRYGEDLENYRSNKKREAGHVEHAGYYFKCPKCRDECNCPRCRKSKGLEPIGTMKKTDKVSAKKEKPAKKETETQSAPPQPKKRAQPKPKPKPKILPAVKWTHIAPELTHTEVEERMHIREFVTRFNALSEAALHKPQLEELEQINGKFNGQEALDPASWVSDGCAKAIVLMLLGMLSGDENHAISEASQIAIGSLRNAGFSLTKVWNTLVEWQESIVDATSDEDAVPLEEPLPPSDFFFSQARRSTRTMASAATNTGIAIYGSVQLIPPILSLIDLTLELPGVRESLDEGGKEAREIHRKSREAIKVEAERWDAVKKQQEQTKDKAAFQEAKRLHKDILTALEKSSEVGQYEGMTRFAPLATDPEGRVYYALAPGYAEHEAAVEYIELFLSGVALEKQKLKKKGRVLKPSEREDMHDWSWMILVWGKKPPSAYCPVSDDGDESDEELDEEVERWWSFSDPSDIKDLAEWLVLAYDLDAEDSEHASLKGLATSIKDFGSLLEWRLREDKYQLPTAASAGGISVKSFYGKSK